MNGETFFTMLYSKLKKIIQSLSQQDEKIDSMNSNMITEINTSAQTVLDVIGTTSDIDGSTTKGTLMGKSNQSLTELNGIGEKIGTPEN